MADTVEGLIVLRDVYRNTLSRENLDLIADAANEITKLRASRERLKSAVEFAHSEGFQWPSDPMAEFA